MAICRSAQGQLSATWLENARKANPNAKNLVILTKRPKLKADQSRAAKSFGKTKCRVGMTALVTDEVLPTFGYLSQFCTHTTIE